MKYFEPDFKYKKMEDIDLEVLKHKGITSLILDIDNTLVEPHTPVADQRATCFVNNLKENGFKLCIVSNNIPERAKKFADSLSLEFVCDKNKPHKRPFFMAMEILNAKENEIAVIGDQVLTDVWGAKRMKMTSVLLEPVCDKEEWFVKFKRKIEKLLIKR